jgi:hypothetical protein
MYAVQYWEGGTLPVCRTFCGRDVLVKRHQCIGKNLLQRIISCVMANEDYPEDLKLEIIHAIHAHPTDIDE